jgi:hypothetical protein
VDKSTKNPQVDALFEYEPQNDWVNYLSLLNSNDASVTQKDREYIQNIIDRYQLRGKNGELNTEFYKFCLILRDEYEAAVNLNQKNCPAWLDSP